MLEGTSGDRPRVAKTWSALDAGPDIDRRVEREIFGRSGDARCFYSVDDSAAQSVIERTQALLPGARLRCDAENGIFRCEWRSGKTLLGSAAANRSALAVCAASLQACRSGAAVASGQALRRSAPMWSPAASAPSSSGAPRP